MLAQNQPQQKISSPVDPLAPYRTKAVEVEKKILQDAGITYSVAKVCSLLKIDPAKLESMRQQHKLVGLPLENGDRVYPQWQFVKAWFFRYRILRGLDLVLAALNHSDSWEQVAFLLDPLVATDISTPLAALQDGQIAQVLTAAHNFGCQGTA
jgi:hypothetical protein